jgi:hypothetical protein
MRTMLKISMDFEAANQAQRSGAMQQTIDALMELVQPESSYFTTAEGKRTGYVFFDLTDVSLIPQIAEPLFQNLGAELDFSPVMNREELSRGLQSYGKVRKAA